MKKIMMLILVCAMVFSLAACGAEKPAEVAAPASAAPTAGSAQEQAPVISKVDTGIDPTLINFGSSGGETHMGDNWYVDGVKGDNYIYFEKADNANAGFACVKVEGGNVAKTWLCKVESNNHVVDQDGSKELDLVFEDDMSAYNNASGVRYVRGNVEEIAKLFADKPLMEQENNANTLILNADGTGKEVFDGKEDSLTWKIVAATQVSVSDSEYEYIFTVNTDEAGNLVSLTEQNFRCFVPAA